MEENQTHEIEMPAPSFWPLVLAFGLLLIVTGIIFSLIISAVGIVTLLVALVAWTLENRSATSHVLYEVPVAEAPEETSHD